MSNDQGGYPQNPAQQPPAYPGAPVPPQQQPSYPAAAPAPQAPVPPAPAYPGAAPAQPLPPQSAPTGGGYPASAPGYPGAPGSAPGYAQPGAPAYAQPGAPAYAQPYAQPYGQPYPTPKKSNGLAVTALICGIAGLVFFWIAYLVLPFLASIAAIVTGHMGLGRIKRDPDLGGKGMAITGLVLGYVGAVLNLVVGAIVIIGFLFVASHSYNSSY